MATIVSGSAVNGGYSAAAASHTVTQSPAVDAGQALLISALINEDSKGAAIAGYSSKEHPFTVGSTAKILLFAKAAVGDEDGAGVSLGITPSGTAALTRSCVALSGVDTASIFNGNNGVAIVTADSASFSIPADSITVTPGSALVVVVACEANRSVITPGAGLVPISNTATTNSLHVYFDEVVEGSGNPQYDFVMSSNRQYSVALFEIKAGATGPAVTFITNPVVTSCSATLSEPAPTVDTITYTYGGVTQTQSFTTGDNQNYSIATVTRNLLPPTGTVTVTFLDGVTEIASTTTVLDDIPGWETTDLVSPVTTDGSVFYNHTGDAPATGDKVRHDDPGNTTISAEGILTQVTPRTVNVEAWDDSTETYGALGTFTYSTDTGQLVRVLQATELESTGMSATSLSATML